MTTIRRICYFGAFDPDYERNRVLISGLRANGVQVDCCTVRGKGMGALWHLWRARRILTGRYDVVIVGYSDTRAPVVLARLLFRCPIIWDAFYSLYDSYVFDRGLVAQQSVKARYYWLLDWIACRSANRILLDTQVHIEYFEKTFSVPASTCIRAFVGADNTLFHP